MRTPTPILPRRCWMLLIAFCLAGALATGAVGCAFSAPAVKTTAPAGHTATVAAATSTTATTPTQPAGPNLAPDSAESESAMTNDSAVESVNPPEDKDNFFRSTYLAARLALSSGDKAQAAKLLDECRQRPGCPPVIYAALAEAQLAQVDLDKAQATLADGLKVYPENPRLLLMQARALRQTGKIDEALSALDKVLVADPHNQKALEDLSELHLQKLRGVTSDEALNKEIAELIKVYERLLEGRRGTERLGPLLILSSLYLRTDKPERAIAAGEEAVSINRHEIRCYQALATAQETLKHNTDAIKTYKDALLLDPNNQEVRAKLEKLLTATGGPKAALSFYADLAQSLPEEKEVQDLYLKALVEQENWGEADKVLAHILTRWPDDKEDRVEQVRVWIAEGRIDEALAQVDKLAKDNADLAPLVTLAAAEALAGHNQRTRAEDVLRKFQTTHPTNENVTMALAGLLIEDKQTDEASRMLEAFHRERPDFFLASVLLVQVYADQKRYAEAQTMLAGLPDNVKKDYKKDLLQMQADLYRRQKTWDKALETVQQLIQLDPENAQNYLQAGIINQEMGRPADAETQYQKALQLDPDDAETNNTLAFFYAETNQKLDQALDLVNKALKAKPNAGHIVDSLGWVLYRRGDFQGATEKLEQAAKLMEAPDPVVFEHLGDAYEKLGRPDKAQEAWKKSLALDQESASVKEKLARVAPQAGAEQK